MPEQHRARAGSLAGWQTEDQSSGDTVAFALQEISFFFRYADSTPVQVTSLCLIKF